MSGTNGSSDTPPPKSGLGILLDSELRKKDERIAQLEATVKQLQSSILELRKIAENVQTAIGRLSKRNNEISNQLSARRDHPKKSKGSKKRKRDPRRCKHMNNPGGCKNPDCRFTHIGNLNRTMVGGSSSVACVTSFTSVDGCSSSMAPSNSSTTATGSSSSAVSGSSVAVHIPSEFNSFTEDDETSRGYKRPRTGTDDSNSPRPKTYGMGGIITKNTCGGCGRPLYMATSCCGMCGRCCNC